ncbi:hypothetical protein F2P81_005368 [Scophthalmus maximus]|uniref:Uncharacterized protein n=1 Tax=Scophthalmus maximus TaxID=52904 RepID=A0A6A4T2Y1_SCOMX|nr:hypothetical protein F2P81_005368 [Scophthalmus maximus]
MVTLRGAFSWSLSSCSRRDNVTSLAKTAHLNLCSSCTIAQDEKDKKKEEHLMYYGTRFIGGSRNQSN